MNKWFYTGILLVVLSYSPIFFPEEVAGWGFYSRFIFFVLFLAGIIMISEAITLKLSKKSLVREITKSRNNLVSFLAVSVIGGFIVELVVDWLGKLWIYPGWDFSGMLLFSIPCFATYWLVITESYLATKAIFDYLHKGKTYVKTTFNWEKVFFPGLGMLGTLLLVIAATLFIQDYSGQTLRLGEVRDLNYQTSNYVLPFELIMLLVLSTWFILEYFEYREHKTSLIKDIIHHYPTPLISILLGSFVLAIMMESQNLIPKVWLYMNWPLPEITFIGLPVTMFLAWPLHYIGFLSLFRVFNRDESSEIWKGDLIE